MERGVRPPVDRDGDPSVAAARAHLRALLGVEVRATAERRPPAPDRQQREVEAGHEPGHLREEVGVAREVDASASRAPRSRAPVRAPGTAAGRRRGRRRSPRSRSAPISCVSPTSISCTSVKPRRRAAARAREARRSGSHDRRGRATPTSRWSWWAWERRTASTGLQGVGVHRHATPQVRDEQAEQRVGEQPHAVERDQHGRVPDPPDARRVRAAGWASTGRIVGRVGQRRGSRRRREPSDRHRASHRRLREPHSALSGPSAMRRVRPGRATIDERSRAT